MARPKFKVEMTEGAIRVRHDGRTLTIHAEAPDGDSDETTDFVVRLDNLDHWDAPDQDREIGIDELQGILDAVEKEMAKHGLSVDFD
ncbi:MAG: Imm74 family immunity protein [Methylocystis sp.]|uniref:Imm74 family immunity protein n=1 Tax=Methylocystis sp. TaxID=1911079 RepID=UPI003DA1DCC0